MWFKDFRERHHEESELKLDLSKLILDVVNEKLVTGDPGSRAGFSAYPKGKTIIISCGTGQESDERDIKRVIKEFTGADAIPYRDPMADGVASLGGAPIPRDTNSAFSIEVTPAIAWNITRNAVANGQIPSNDPLIEKTARYISAHDKSGPGEQSGQSWLARHLHIRRNKGNEPER